MQTQAESLDIADEALQQAHVLLVDGLTTLHQTFETYARALERGDNALFSQAKEEHVKAVQNIGAWRAAIAPRQGRALDPAP
jgi:hypothetical protein